VDAAPAVAVAAIFVWLGMVAAISFLETPVKFRAPGVTLQIGLGIGRLVFRALNACELVLALGVAVCLVLAVPPAGVAVAAGVAIASLVVQLLGVRPRLTRRSDGVLAGAGGPRSRAHWVYVGFEVVKVSALVVAGVALLAG
jgi:apolipoprotein N-acyltransferase